MSETQNRQYAEQPPEEDSMIIDAEAKQKFATREEAIRFWALRCRRSNDLARDKIREYATDWGSRRFAAECMWEGVPTGKGLYVPYANILFRWLYDYAATKEQWEWVKEVAVKRDIEFATGHIRTHTTAYIVEVANEKIGELEKSS
jgi:hypothetical protein